MIRDRSVSFGVTLILLLIFLAQQSLEGWAQEDIYEKIYKLVAPAQGTVRVEPNKLGSGFVIKDDGLVVTNFHVVKNMCNGELEVGLIGQLASYPFTSVYQFRPEADIAILRVRGAGLPTVRLGSSNGLQRGTTLYTIGSPENLPNIPGEGKFRGFLISDEFKKRAADNPKFAPLTKNLGKGLRIIHHSIPIASGSSGSPLLDRNLEVVGVNFAGLGAGDNNFAIPIEIVRELLGQPSLGLNVNLLCELTQVTLPLQFRPYKDLDIRRGKPAFDAAKLCGSDTVYAFKAEDGSTFWVKDRSQDGKVDCWVYDTLGKGKRDWIIMDTDGDGIPDQWRFDLLGIGKFELVGYDDTPRDGIPDKWIYLDTAGKPLIYARDLFQRGVLVQLSFDLNGDGISDVTWQRELIVTGESD